VVVGADGVEAWTSPLGFVYSSFPDGTLVDDPDPPDERDNLLVTSAR
jgi:hypothetical protein